LSQKIKSSGWCPGPGNLSQNSQKPISLITNVPTKLRGRAAAKSLCAVATMLANNVQLQQKLCFSTPTSFRAALLKIGGNIACHIIHKKTRNPKAIIFFIAN